MVVIGKGEGLGLQGKVGEYYCATIIISELKVLSDLQGSSGLSTKYCNFAVKVEKRKQLYEKRKY
jgi:hypothetical protein